MSVLLADDEARALAALVARALVVTAREEGARPTAAAVDLLRRLAEPAREVTEPPEAPREVVGVREAARRMGCSPAYVRRLAAHGRIEAHKLGSTWAIRWPTTVSPPQPREAAARIIAA